MEGTELVSLAADYRPPLLDKELQAVGGLSARARQSRDCWAEPSSWLGTVPPLRPGTDALLICLLLLLFDTFAINRGDVVF